MYKDVKMTRRRPALKEGDGRPSQEADKAGKKATPATAAHQVQRLYWKTGTMSKHEILARKPEGATALIVAEWEEDKSDVRTDYFNTTTSRTVAIGWMFTRRMDFRTLRKVAAKFPPTAHLGPGLDRYEVVLLDGPDSRSPGYSGTPLRDKAGFTRVFGTEEEAKIAAEEAKHPFGCRISKESAEHRENWSMGHGNYLKSGSRYSTGWVVRTIGLDWLPDKIEDALDGSKKTEVGR